MKQSVNILVTVHSPEMLDAALLVFKTIRTGFPTANVNVWGNNLSVENVHKVIDTGNINWFTNLQTTSHDAWVEKLILELNESFWICDTDVVLFDKVEDWFSNGVILAGRFNPAYREPWTNAKYIERLHTCLMYINPIKVRNEMANWSKYFIPANFHSAQVPFIRQNFIAFGLDIYLYDTMAGVCQLGIGTKFTPEQDSAFEHLHAGTYADKVSKDCEELKYLREAHKLIYKDFKLAKGLKQIQDKFYLKHKI